MSQFQHITIQQTQTLLSNDSATIVDVRDPQSFALGHINTAKYVNNENIQDFIREADLDRSLVVYCYHGNASQSAAQFFVEQGFEDVYSMDGGFEAWRTQYPATENTNG